MSMDLNTLLNGQHDIHVRMSRAVQGGSSKAGHIRHQLLRHRDPDQNPRIICRRNWSHSTEFIRAYYKDKYDENEYVTELFTQWEYLRDTT